MQSDVTAQRWSWLDDGTVKTPKSGTKKKQNLRSFTRINDDTILSKKFQKSKKSKKSKFFNFFNFKIFFRVIFDVGECLRLLFIIQERKNETDFF